METESLETLLALCLSNPENRRFFYVVCDISEPEIAFASAEAGFDLLGFRHVVDNFALQHTLRKHGNPMTEAARGQIAVAPETFEFISLIVSKYDRLQYEFVKNRHSFLFEKMIGDRVCHYIAEIRVGRKKQICAQSLWIRKTKKPLV